MLTDTSTLQLSKNLLWSPVSDTEAEFIGGGGSCDYKKEQPKEKKKDDYKDKGCNPCKDFDYVVKYDYSAYGVDVSYFVGVDY